MSLAQRHEQASAQGSAQSPIQVGCAGWSLPRAAWPEFPVEGSHLTRYAARFNSVEINSSFYRPHQPATYARWGDSVPDHFRFAVKVPKTITHTGRLRGCEGLLDTFLSQCCALGHKLGCLLVQLPPSLGLEPMTASEFMKGLRRRHKGSVALEARHASWFTAEAELLLKSYRVARVLADPVMFDAGRLPGGDLSFIYLRLHGSPRMYYSAYEHSVLDKLAVRLQTAAASQATAWCIFDNTAAGAAVPDALYTLAALTAPQAASSQDSGK